MAQKMTSRCANKTPVHDDELANVMSQLRLEGASKGPRLSSAQMLPQDQFKHKDTIREETNFNDGLDTFEGKTWHELQQWKGFQPSKVTITKGGIRQFSFQNPNFKGNDKTLNDEEMTALCNEFLAMNKRKKNEHAIKNLAKKHGLTSGKWMIMAKWPLEVDQLWEKLLRLLYEDSECELLGDCVREVKVAVYDPNEENPHVKKDKFRGGPRTKISVMTADYTDEEKTVQIGEKLQELGFKSQDQALKYKPDIYSKLEIFANNAYNIRPSIYII